MTCKLRPGFARVALLAVCAQAQVPEHATPPLLEVGATLAGSIDDRDAHVRTDALDAARLDAPVLGKSYELRVAESGPYTIDLHSFDFDTYLVLRDSDGRVRAEDDDGLVALHSRIVVNLDAGRSYRLVACAKPGWKGEFWVKLTAGRPARLGPVERLQFELDDARERVEYMERRGEDGASLGSALRYLAGRHRARGELDKAKPIYERALAIQERTVGPDDPATCMTLTGLAQLLQMQGRLEEARPLFERLLARAEENFGPSGLETATALNNLASVLGDLGQYEDACSLFERAVGILDANVGYDDSDAVRIVGNLGYWLTRLGRYAEAEKHLQRALSMFEEASGPDHSDVAWVLHLLGVLMAHQRRHDEARRHLERALAIDERVLGPEHTETGLVLHDLGAQDYLLGRLESARPLLERALSLFERQLGPQHPHTSECVEALALVFEEQGLRDESRKLRERVVASREALLGPDHPDTARAIHGLALQLKEEGRYDEAIALLERTLSICQAKLGPSHPNTLSTVNVLGGVLLEKGDLAAARPLLERTLAVRERELGPEHDDTSDTLNDLGKLCYREGEIARAEALFERGLENWRKSVGREHPKTIATLDHLALLHSDRGQAEEAWQCTLESIAASQALLERTLWSLSESERLQYASRFVYELEVLLSVARLAPSADSQRLAYEAVLAWKGRVSRSLLQSRERLWSTLDPDARAKLTELEKTQSLLSRELYAQESHDDAARGERIAALRERRSQLETELARTVGRSEPPAPVSTAALASALAPDAALVDFYVHRTREPAVLEGDRVVQKARFNPPQLSAWIVRRGGGGPVHVDLGQAEPIESAVNDLLSAMAAQGPARGVGVSAAEARSVARQASAALRAALWEKLAPSLGDASTIFVSPDGFLGGLPFEVLPLDDKSYLIEQRRFVYLRDATSLASLARDSSRAPSAPSLLLFGAVDYGRRGALAEPSSGARGALSDERLRGLRIEWAELPATRTECDSIAELHARAFGADVPRMELDGDGALEERLKRELQGFSVAHIATHGFFEPEGLPSMWASAKAAEVDSPEPFEEERRLTGMLPGLLSGLVCAGANVPAPEDRDDGLLTAEELSFLDLSKVDLVVLSACETGLGRAESGEGMLGLRRTLRQAGARTVISSLWSVRDESTSELMRELYERLWIEKQSKLDALRGAQLEMLKKNRAENSGDARPSTWGAFVLEGDWR